jgi:hypothetical protein
VAKKISEPKTLRTEAANCRTLAARISDEQGRRKLEAMATDYENQATALETAELLDLSVT